MVARNLCGLGDREGVQFLRLVNSEKITHANEPETLVWLNLSLNRGDATGQIRITGAEINIQTKD